MRRFLYLMSLASLCLLSSGCETIAPKKPAPDLRITVKKDANGVLKAVPPECADWKQDGANPFDNQPLPQFGCATARNLAVMVENPKDLVKGRELGRFDGEYAASTTLRYRSGVPKPLIDPKDPKPVAQPSLKDSGLK